MLLISVKMSTVNQFLSAIICILTSNFKFIYILNSIESIVLNKNCRINFFRKLIIKLFLAFSEYRKSEVRLLFLLLLKKSQILCWSWLSQVQKYKLALHLLFTYYYNCALCKLWIPFYGKSEFWEYTQNSFLIGDIQLVQLLCNTRNGNFFELAFKQSSLYLLVLCFPFDFNENKI